MKTIASHYYTAETVMGEKEFFNTLPETKKWAERVRFTFSLPEMAIEIREITEKIITD